MGWVMMSERELNRVEVLAQVDDGRLTVDNAANLLDLTRRQIFRLLKRFRQDRRICDPSQGARQASEQPDPQREARLCPEPDQRELRGFRPDTGN